MIPNRHIQWQHVFDLLNIQKTALLVMTYLECENTEREAWENIDIISQLP